MLDNTKTDPRWLEVRYTSNHPYFDHISRLCEKGQMMTLREMKEALHEVDFDLGREVDAIDDPEVGEAISNALDSVRRVRRDLTLLLGDKPDGLLEGYWDESCPEPDDIKADPDGLPEPDWQYLIEELERAHKFMGRYDPPGSIKADIPAFAMADLTQWLIREGAASSVWIARQ